MIVRFARRVRGSTAERRGSRAAPARSCRPARRRQAAIRSRRDGMARTKMAEGEASGGALSRMLRAAHVPTPRHRPSRRALRRRLRLRAEGDPARRRRPAATRAPQSSSSSAAAAATRSRPPAPRARRSSPNNIERKDGPNFDTRAVEYDEALYAIQNGGFSSGPMPQNIVVGERRASSLASSPSTRAPKPRGPTLAGRGARGHRQANLRVPARRAGRRGVLDLKTIRSEPERRWPRWRVAATAPTSVSARRSCSTRVAANCCRRWSRCAPSRTRRRRRSARPRATVRTPARRSRRCRTWPRGPRR